MIETIQTNDGIDEQGSDMKGSQLQAKDEMQTLIDIIQIKQNEKL